ncbi:MAG: rhombosortase, partial [Deltaproteobacteria bacterium]|nr:rhombosortase [Deltaproteobacteria bacterium]
PGLGICCRCHRLDGCFGRSESASVRRQLYEPADLFSEALRAGQWWRLFSHPFVHLTWYHLLLDAGAFFILYTGLQEKRVICKLTIAFACSGFSLIAALCFTPDIEAKGLCGLSGIAHGLMAHSGLELIHTRKRIWVGLFSFLLVFIKSIYEFITGEVVFTFMHMGLCGSPLAACHLGGVMGGILSFFIFCRRNYR